MNVAVGRNMFKLAVNAGGSGVRWGLSRKGHIYGHWLVFIYM